MVDFFSIFWFVASKLLSVTFKSKRPSYLTYGLSSWIKQSIPARTRVFETYMQNQIWILPPRSWSETAWGNLHNLESSSVACMKLAIRAGPATAQLISLQEACAQQWDVWWCCYCWLRWWRWWQFIVILTPNKPNKVAAHSQVVNQNSDPGNPEILGPGAE